MKLDGQNQMESHGWTKPNGTKWTKLDGTKQMEPDGTKWTELDGHWTKADGGQMKLRLIATIMKGDCNGWRR